MPDLHWIFFAEDGFPAHEVRARDVLRNFKYYDGKTFLVSEETWQNYQRALERLRALEFEIKTQRRAKLALCAEYEDRESAGSLLNPVPDVELAP